MSFKLKLVINCFKINAPLKILQLHAMILVLETEFSKIINAFVLVELMIMEIIINANSVIILGSNLFDLY